MQDRATGGDQASHVNYIEMSACGTFALVHLPNSPRRALIDAEDIERVHRLA